MADGSWLTGRRRQAWVSFLGAHTLVERVVERHLHDAAGISHAEYEILSRLRNAGGRLRMGELASVLFSPGSRLNYRITRLAGLGFVRREQHPVDRRGLYAVLTAEGAEFLERVQPGYGDAVQRAIGEALTEDEFLELGRLSDKVFRALCGPGAT
ncbi:DNA-binding MarR family transcriptional regulator [Amycolatopsis bartoniae]|uniref:MarR family transcriptional regulator n=1 Tax=Amycolatopsis bartoniae TaxID=941986 RepID=A0A8H9MCG7_9PSEU|nr:MarR family transcriptional regulator [Amycolatopsis bartoniae]MBB2934860.1 DNA-binding MarR family transcriptional regulator [Amycolatopsis bartoniae]TVT00746.1 MarR family transcriptional regulator [Amycolatopsis bartoniae]GHF44268.1 MarR family transcriptional regulator [Amycolatopsis bartoniae]